MPSSLDASRDARPGIRREHSVGHALAIVDRGNLQELHLTLWPLPYEQPAAMVDRLILLLHRYEADIVRHEVFGPLVVREEFVRALNRTLGLPAAPILWVEGSACDDQLVAGMHVMAVAGTRVDHVRLEGRVVGTTYHDEHAEHCLLGDVGPVDLSAPPGIQAQQAFENLEAALDRVGMNFTQVARTWLYLDGILDWYGVLNRVRREFFEQRRLFDHVVPASTGIGARNPAGSAMVTGAWAARARDRRFAIREVLSPLQCPAPQYGSCFSRAVEMVEPGWRRLFISGTASIEPKGASVCADDIDGQIDLTMQVIRAILVSREMEYADVTRATAYIRHPGDLSEWNRWRHRLGLDRWPVISNQSVVCRDELLFEVEVDAIAPTPIRPGEWEL